MPRSHSSLKGNEMRKQIGAQGAFGHRFLFPSHFFQLWTNQSEFFLIDNPNLNEIDKIQKFLIVTHKLVSSR